MAHVGYNYDEIEVTPSRLRAHSTPAVEEPYTWLVKDDDNENEE